MNIKKLKQAEAVFLSKYPGGFNHPEMLAVGKKHKMDTMVELAQSCFSTKAFKDTEKIIQDMIRIISRSSMVSMFEKPKFRDFVKRLDNNEKQFLADALKKLLHGKKPQAGFEAMVDLLLIEKLAKWSLVSIIPAYFDPKVEVFVKPTTAKGVIKHFEVPEMVYKPCPSWGFYLAYRELINSNKKKVNKDLSPSNAAFSGFLMMAMNQG